MLQHCYTAEVEMSSFFNTHSYSKKPCWVTDLSTFFPLQLRVLNYRVDGCGKCYTVLGFLAFKMSYWWHSSR